MNDKSNNKLPKIDHSEKNNQFNTVHEIFNAEN